MGKAEKLHPSDIGWMLPEVYRVSVVIQTQEVEA